jgi:hypothetical protein
MEETHNMQLKSLVASLLLRTWQPVTWLACATQAPERPRRLTGCYASSRGIYRDAYSHATKPLSVV